MLRYSLRRIGLAVPQLLLAAVGTFALLRVLPVDPVSKLVGVNPSPAAYAIGRHALGLDQSFWHQLGSYLGGLLHLDLGTSWSTSTSIGSEVLDKFPTTLQFIVPAFIIATVLGVSVGLLIATKPGGRLDKGVTTYALFAGAQPDFWWGLMFVFIFYVEAHLLPAPLGLLDPALNGVPVVTHFVVIDALIAGDLTVFWSAIAHLALPVLTLAFVLTGPIIKMTRQGAEAAYTSDFTLYARACGVPQRWIRRRMIRVAIAPVLNLVGILFGFMLGGAVLIETVFSLDGMGSYALHRTLALDFPAIQSAVLVMTTFALLVYLLMDLVNAALDPRVRLR